MLENGSSFERRGKEYCIIDNLSFDSRNFILLSIIQNDKKDYCFYEITNNIDGYHLEKVNDDNIKTQLFNIIIRSDNINIKNIKEELSKCIMEGEKI